MAKAVHPDAFPMYCVLLGFDLAAFDEWLEALEPCGAKRELAERREWAFQGMADNNRDAALRHLEWMLLRWKYIKRLDYIVPLAKQGKQQSEAQRKRRKDKPAEDSAHDPGRNERIRNFLARCNESNATRLAGVEFGLSDRQIRRIKAT